MDKLAQKSFTEPDVLRCPFPFITHLHEHHPVYRDPATGFYVVTRHHDVANILAQPETFSNATTVLVEQKDSPVADEVARRYAERGFLPVHTLVSADPPVHTRYRSLVNKVFTPAFIKGLEPYLTALVDELIDAFIDRGRVDFLQQFAVKLPMYVIADQLGVPRLDLPHFKTWTDAVVESFTPGLAPERELELADLIIEMQRYLYARAKDYEQAPADTLLSKLVHAEIEGRRLDPAELVALAHQLLVAGSETTANSLALAIHLLIENPAVRRRVDADRDLLPNFVEEVLRLHSPGAQVYRKALRKTEIAGTSIPQGATVMISLLAANRDPATFENPSRLDLDRRNRNQHLAFGRGIHFCIGSQLSRTELRIALDRILTRMPRFRLDPEKPRPRFAQVFQTHGLENLDLVF